MEPKFTVKQKRGHWAEEKAANYLREILYEILTRNFRCKLGEIGHHSQRW